MGLASCRLLIELEPDDIAALDTDGSFSVQIPPNLQQYCGGLKFIDFKKSPSPSPVHSSRTEVESLGAHIAETSGQGQHGRPRHPIPV
jgi:hypothetical protein